MGFEIYNAFRKAGITEADAKAAVESIHKVIDMRYEIHQKQLATRGDLADLKSEVRSDIANYKIEMMKWMIGSVFTAVGIFAAIVKLFFR